MRYKKGLTSAAVITAATLTASVYAAAHRATLRAPCWGRSVGGAACSHGIQLAMTLDGHGMQYNCIVFLPAYGTEQSFTFRLQLCGLQVVVGLTALHLAALAPDEQQQSNRLCCCVQVTVVRWSANGDLLASVGDDWVVRVSEAAGGVVICSWLLADTVDCCSRHGVVVGGQC